jgi:hypothetical protein
LTFFSSSLLVKHFAFDYRVNTQLEYSVDVDFSNESAGRGGLGIDCFGRFLQVGREQIGSGFSGSLNVLRYPGLPVVAITAPLNISQVFTIGSVIDTVGTFATYFNGTEFNNVASCAEYVTISVDTLLNGVSIGTTSFARQFYGVRCYDLVRLSFSSRQLRTNAFSLFEIETSNMTIAVA